MTRTKSGFTLVELMIVITIISVLAIISVGPLMRVGADAANKAAEMQINQILSATELFKTDFGIYPLANEYWLIPSAASNPLNILAQKLCQGLKRNDNTTIVTAITLVPGDENTYSGCYLEDMPPELISMKEELLDYWDSPYFYNAQTLQYHEFKWKPSKTYPSSGTASYTLYANQYWQSNNAANVAIIPNASGTDWNRLTGTTVAPNHFTPPDQDFALFYTTDTIVKGGTPSANFLPSISWVNSGAKTKLIGAKDVAVDWATIDFEIPSLFSKGKDGVNTNALLYNEDAPAYDAADDADNIGGNLTNKISIQ